MNNLIYTLWFFIINIDLTLILGLMFGLVLLRRKYYKLILAYAFLFSFIYFLPLGKFGIYQLEQKYINYVEQDIENYSPDGFIYLGGAIIRDQSTAPANRVIYNEAAPRIIEFAQLLYRFPSLQAVLTGTVGEMKNMEVYLKTMNVTNKLLLLPNARNTVDNAKSTLDGNPELNKKRWVLVTSAYHLPRSLYLFKKAGWENIFPYPVNFFFGKNNPFFSLVEYIDGRNLRAWKIFIKELAGRLNH